MEKYAKGTLPNNNGGCIKNYNCRNHLNHGAIESLREIRKIFYKHNLLQN